MATKMDGMAPVKIFGKKRRDGYADRAEIIKGISQFFKVGIGGENNYVRVPAKLRSSV
jgi:hypothetical protein